MARIVRIGCLAGLLAAGWCARPADAALSASDVTQRVQRQYGTIRSVSADFVQTSRLGPTNQSGQVKGRILLKKQNKVRVEMAGQVIVSDGKSVWAYVPENQQVLVSRADRRRGGMRPDDFLFYYSSQYVPALVGEEALDGVPHYVLKLTPKDPESDVQELRVWVDSRQWFTRKVVYTDATGSTVTTVFSNIRLNPPLPDATFVMPIPKGVEVVDLR